MAEGGQRTKYYIEASRDIAKYAHVQGVWIAARIPEADSTKLTFSGRSHDRTARSGRGAYTGRGDAMLRPSSIAAMGWEDGHDRTRDAGHRFQEQREGYLMARIWTCPNCMTRCDGWRAIGLHECQKGDRK